MKNRILIDSLSRATPTSPPSPNRSITGALLVASLLANVFLFRTVRILYADNLDMRAYMDAIVGNFRYLKPEIEGELNVR